MLLDALPAALAHAAGLLVPALVLGVVVGAVGLEGLKEKISTARCGKASC